MPVSPPANELIDRWASYIEYDKGRSPQTVTKYCQYIVRLVTWLESPPPEKQLAPAGKPDLLTVTTADLQVFAGIWAHKQGLSAAARMPLISAIRNFYAWAHKQGLIATNPGEHLESPRPGKRLPRAASLEWVEKLMQAPDIATFRGLRDALIMALLAGCGMRVSGVCNLNEGSLVWTLDDKGIERLSIRVTEKGKKERLLPAPDEVAMLVRAYLGHPDLHAIDRALPNADAVLLVATMANGACPPQDWHGEARRIHRRTILGMFTRYAKRAGIDPSMAHPHALRHLYGTELAEADVDVIQRGALLGHEDPRTTEIYTHLAQRKLRVSVDKANPLAKMRTPLLDSLRALTKASVRPPARASVAPNPARKT